MTLRVLVLRYSAFAILATLANLLTQRAVLGQAVGGTRLAAAIGAGTIVGLGVKYVLDKRWIFHDAETGLASHGRKFTLYATMGVFTTLLFWGSETAFWLAFRSDAMREVGALLGLGVGYVVKYNLDKRFVFATRTP